MIDVAERSTVYFSLIGYLEMLRMQRGPFVTIADVQGIPLRDEKERVRKMALMFKDSFVYVSDEILDRSKLYIEGAEKQPAFIALFVELQALVNKAQIHENYVDDVTASGGYATLDIDATARMREIVNILNAGVPESRTLDSDIVEDRH